MFVSVKNKIYSMKKNVRQLRKKTPIIISKTKPLFEEVQINSRTYIK